MTFPSRTFVDYQGNIPAEWLNAVDEFCSTSAGDPDNLTDATLDGSERVAIKQSSSWFRTTIQSIASWAHITSSPDSVAALRLNAAPWLKVVRTAGYYVPRDGGHGEYVKDSADMTTADDGFLCIVDAGGRRWKLNTGAEINPKWAGARGDGSADDRNPIQAVLNYARTLPSAKVVFPPAYRYKCNSGIEIDGATTAVDFGGNYIDFVGMSSGFAITITTSEDDPSSQNPLLHSRCVIERGYFAGPGSPITGVTAMRIQDVSGTGLVAVSGATVRNCSFVNFAKDVLFGDGSFCNSFERCNFTHIGQAAATTHSISSLNGVVHSGERHSFTGCMWNNRDLILLHSNGAGNMFFHDCSFDYFPTRAMTITDGSVRISQCHIENDTDASQWFFVDGENAALTVENSELLITGAKANYGVFHSSNASTTFGVTLRNIRLAGSISTITSALVTGTGVVVASDIKTWNSVGQPVIAQRLNLINDPSFEALSFPEWVIAGGVTRSTAEARSGSSSAQLAGSVSALTSMQVTRRCSQQQMPSGELWYKSSGVAGSGVTPYISMDYLSESGAIILSTNWLSLSTNVASWTQLRIRPFAKTPTAVAAVRLNIVVPNGSATPRLWIDDVVLNVV